MEKSVWSQFILNWSNGLIIGKISGGCFTDVATFFTSYCKHWELGKEIEIDIFFLVTSQEQGKNSEFSFGIEPQTFRFCTPLFYHYQPQRLYVKMKFIYNIPPACCLDQQCQMSHVCKWNKKVGKFWGQ